MTAARIVDVALPAASVRFTVAAASDTGAVRRVNEDSLFAEPPVFVVADGMGGHSFGDEASAAATSAFAGAFAPAAPATVDAVLDAVQAANRAVIAIGARHERSFSGTTITGVALVESGPDSAFAWLAFNVGDSRIYRFRAGAIAQLSVDHSVVQELLDGGLIAPHEVASHPDRNVVTRALGAHEDVEADVWLFPLETHQTFLLCSDGLSKELDDREIGRILAEADPAAEESVAERLVRAAVAAGGRDNVTAIVVEAELVGARSGSGDDTVDREPWNEDTKPRA